MIAERKAGRGRILDPEYCAWIRTLPCVVCLTEGPKLVARGITGGLYEGCVQISPTECAHVGPRGLSQKCNDRETLPLCRDEHHQHGPESVHVLGKRFWEHHGLDREQLIREHNGRYGMEHAT